MKSHVASATNAVIICITVFSFYIFIENCVLDLSSFELNEHNEMTLNKVSYVLYNEHRAHGPCHCGPQNSFLGGHYLSTMVKSQSCKIQLLNQLNIIYTVTYQARIQDFTLGGALFGEGSRAQLLSYSRV